jgi:hypothetical protein
VFVEGSTEWRRFLTARRACDDGRLTPVLSLRALEPEERLLVVDWGSAFANALLLIEPRDARLDLTAGGSSERRRLVEMAGHAPARSTHESRDGAPDLGELVCGLLGRWTSWTWSPLGLRWASVDLATTGNDGLAGAVLDELRSRYTQEAFDATVFDLYLREPELFGGSVLRCRMPFRTRLGLPVLHDERFADRALRRLVNEGGARVYRYSAEHVVRFGPGRPVPDAMSDEEFASLRM